MSKTNPFIGVPVGSTGSFSIACRRGGRQNACPWRVDQIRRPLGFCGYGPAGKARAVALALRADRLIARWRNLATEASS